MKSHGKIPAKSGQIPSQNLQQNRKVESFRKVTDPFILVALELHPAIVWGARTRRPGGPEGGRSHSGGNHPQVHHINVVFEAFPVMVGGMVVPTKIDCRLRYLHGHNEGFCWALP